MFHSRQLFLPSTNRHFRHRRYPRDRHERKRGEFDHSRARAGILRFCRRSRHQRKFGGKVKRRSTTAVPKPRRFLCVVTSPYIRIDSNSNSNVFMTIPAGGSKPCSLHVIIEAYLDRIRHRRVGVSSSDDAEHLRQTLPSLQKHTFQRNETSRPASDRSVSLVSTFQK